MLGLNIITKSGILVFSHAFTGRYFTDIDMDLQAGFMTAVLNAFKETQGEQIRVIQHKDYVMLLYEGVLTNGILYTTEVDLKLHSFLKDIVLKFELMFTRDLHKGKRFRRKDFELFRNVVKSQYTSIIEIDVSSLAKILETMQNSTISNYVIFETKFFHPVFTHLIDPTINRYIQQITQIFREINYFSIRTNQDVLSSVIRFKNIEIFALKTLAHCLVLFYFPIQMDLNDFKIEFNQIQKRLTE